MKVIALFSQKGGSGKTTLTLHLSVIAHAAGIKVAVLDLDPQGSASSWARTRGADRDPPVAFVPDAALDLAIDGARADGFDWAFIDSPPHIAPLAARIVRVADLVLVPVRPSPMDLAALPATIALIGTTPSAFVLSACPPRAPETEEAWRLLETMGRPVLGPITDRRSFFRALTAGQAVSEFEPDGAAAAEVHALFNSVQEMLK